MADGQLKPYHTTQASTEAYSFSRNPEKKYLNNTFPIMVEIRREGAITIQKPVVMSLHETRDGLFADIRRIFSLQGDKIHLSALFASFGVPGLIAAQDFDSDIGPLIRLLMTRGGVDLILVIVEPVGGTDESGEAIPRVEV